MKPTRREFLITSTTAMCAMSFAMPSFAAAAHPHPAEPFLLEGDPYTAHVDEHGLGGRTWDDAYAHALRFRGTSTQRDEYVLGLEL